MRKTISIILIFVLVQNSILFGLIYITLKANLKSEFVARLSPNDKNIVVINYDSYVDGEKIQYLNEEELKIGNEFYDIVKTETINGKKIIYCINDKEEESLDKSFMDFLASALGLKSRNASKVFSELCMKTAIPLKELELNNFPVNRIIFTINYYPIIQTYLKIPTPPPKQV